MANWGSVDFEEVKQLQERLERLERRDLDAFCRKASKMLAAWLLSEVIPLTPIGKKPKIKGAKTVKATGKSGKTERFLSAEAARLEQYWGGYIGGTLRRGWTAKTHEEAEGGSGSPTAEQAKAFVQGLSVTKVGHEYIIEVINPVEYASYVEFGHRQTPGRYVPALGKRLKSSVAKGQLFMTISEEKLRTIAPRVLQQELDKFLRGVFSGD